ncbi:MAG: Lrp/AsnC family transcriptional regulator [Anaerolineales bacterium]|nr:Lrp/AsnC family transcriptional regulator [Anaerolineales bacterium]MCB0011005.1 Lrp/AsnC family transcriptional regulator [Anaerolineales bacterium]MCB0021010.1 Lrp/AsnC family transcriptional regulator [Anaerolineales bacterium]MCB0027558.1 Lrp/AsnC family transcriptional regulator [Anaerolineales bacterium]MCB8961505.1 Lrp/AsnC family transcriptional regulator [Ardenticatenales bacterium]
MQLDDLDIAILRELQQDGRAAFTDIATKLQVSHGTIRNRVNRLQEEQLLKIIGWVNPQAVGYRLPANIQIAVEPPARIREVALQLVDLPEARFVAMMSGEYDLFVDVNARDIKHLTEFVTEFIYPIAGVTRTRINMYLEVFKIGPSKVSLSAANR